ncbi:glycosyltransferase family 4 protein [Carboxylicivirga linearis]|uniref:Glycosyltransferase family 4 protein n=1 Tax=Carboxylicivirga linearis TaxID=1628157 RepID=A0ABS5K2N5_9BACT|nr:glycosyltransferase family 4 protein [Carboxylicivirga linearis]MBS2100781.1 glycosyltransferase family 4 protein [Carboxylicivirga linearis]
MNIIVLAKDYPPTIGGVENYSYYLAEGLGKRHKVQVITFEGKNNENTFIDHVTVKRIKFGRQVSELLKGIGLFFYLLCRLLGKKIDIVYATTWKVALPAVLIKRLFGYRLFITCHGAEITRHKKSRMLMWLMKKTFSISDKIITVSEFTKSIVHEYSDEINEKVKVVYNGIDIGSLKRYSLKEARNELLLPQEKFIITTISRIDSRKGHELVIRSIPKIIKEDTEFLYVIIGNGPNKNYLEQLVIDMNLKDYVEFKGFVSSKLLDYYYSATDVFVMVNTMDDDLDFEGFGLVFAEAGYYYKPSIGGNNAGPREVISDGETGLLVNSNENDVSTALMYFFSNKSKIQEFGYNANKRMGDLFTIDKMVEGVDKIICEKDMIY